MSRYRNRRINKTLKELRGTQPLKSKSQTIDEYLSALDDEKRIALQKLRKIIRSVAPKAEECISYQLPAFRLNGRMLVWFGAGVNYCSFYPGGIVDRFKKQLDGFSFSKGTIRFMPGNPLPTDLVKKIVEARIADNEVRRAKKKKKIK